MKDLSTFDVQVKAEGSVCLSRANQDALEVFCEVCDNGVVISIVKPCDSGVADLTFGLGPIEVEEPSISPVQG